MKRMCLSLHNLVLVQDCMIKTKRVTFYEIIRKGDVDAPNTLRCLVVQPPVNHAQYLHKTHAALLLESRQDWTRMVKKMIDRSKENVEEKIKCEPIILPICST